VPCSWYLQQQQQQQKKGQLHCCGQRHASVTAAVACLGYDCAHARCISLLRVWISRQHH
jgi:hypothetical protein